MKNTISTVCVLSVFLLMILACSNADTRNYATNSTTSENQNYSDPSASDDISNIAPIVEPTVEPAKSTLKPAVVIAESAELRESPSQNSGVIDSVSEEANLQVVKQKGVWFFVRTEDEKEGWIHGNSIRYLDQTQSRDLTASRDLKVEPETDTEDFVTEYIPPIQQPKNVEIETRRAETFETPIPVYRSTPETETTYSRRQYETPTVTTTGESNTPTARCADGTYSYSANRQGTCSWHGGVAKWLDSSPSSAPSYTAPSSRYSSPSDSEYRPKTVNVRGYTRRDGTYVAPHTRSAPRRRS
jgi:hypothetical protein